jgi:hypothetical protein
LGDIGQVGADGRGAATQPLDQGADLKGGLVRSAMVDGDVMAGLGQGQADGPADPAAAACDQGDGRCGHQSTRPNSMKFTATTAAMNRKMGSMAAMGVSLSSGAV